MMKIYATSNLLDQINFIFNEKYQRVNDTDEADFFLIPYSFKEQLKEDIKETPCIFLAVNSDDLEAFSKIQNSTLSLQPYKWTEKREIIVLGYIAVEPNDFEIELKNIKLGLKRKNQIYSYVYITEFHRKMMVNEITEILERYFSEISSSLNIKTPYNKKTWSSIQRTLSFLFAFNEGVNISEFKRLAEIEEIEDWVNDLIDLGVFNIDGEQIFLTDNAKEILENKSKEWKELKKVLEEI
ncbi:MAG: hypothetical protein ACTSP3_04450 [Candidatus Heimdallarchaeaceae archaeon]